MTHIQREQARYRAGELKRPPNKRRAKWRRDDDLFILPFVRRMRRSIRSAVFTATYDSVAEAGEYRRRHLDAFYAFARALRTLRDKTSRQRKRHRVAKR